MTRQSYPDRIAAQAYKDNLEMARSCDRTNLKALDEACQWLATQTAEHSEAGVLLDELRPIRDSLMETKLREQEPVVPPLSKQSWELMDQQLKDAVESRQLAEAALTKLIGENDQRDWNRHVSLQTELKLIEAAAQVCVSGIHGDMSFDSVPGQAVLAACRFLTDRWKDKT